MKKVILFVLAIAICSTTTFGQKVATVKDTTYSTTIPAPHKSALMTGRALYFSTCVGSATPPNPVYGLTFEAGVWGTDKPTSLGLDVDWLKQSGVTTTDTVTHKSSTTKPRFLYIGPKVYLTVLNDKRSCWMVYMSPKFNVLSLPNSELLEVGINPCFSLNKHFIVSMAVCNQFTRTATWNLGGSFGIVLIK